MLTPRELNQIRDYLLMYGKKDSDLNRIADNPVALTDYVATLREDLNIKATIQDLTDFILDYLGLHGVIDPENPDEHLVLSHNDFTDDYKDKLDDIQPGSEVNVIEKIKVDDTPATELPIGDDKSVIIPVRDRIEEYIMNPSSISSTNKLTDKNYVDTQISQSSARFIGTDTTSTTEADFKAWANTQGADANDYAFWQVDITGTDQHKFRRYKYTGDPTDVDSGWKFEYELLPYYLNADDYPSENSENAVKASGIFAFTGDVHKDSDNEYIPLQDQVDDVNGTIYNIHATPSFVISPSSFLIKQGTASVSPTAVAKIIFNGVNENPNNYSVSFNNDNWSAQKNTVSNQYDCSRSSALTASETVIMTFTKGSSFSKSVSSSIYIYYPIYYGVTSETSDPSNITVDAYTTTAKSTTANTGYSVTTTTINKYFFIAVPKAGANVAEPTQYSLTSQYDSPGTLTALTGTANISINSVNIPYKFFISAPQTAASSTYYTR